MAEARALRVVIIGERGAGKTALGARLVQALLGEGGGGALGDLLPLGDELARRGQRREEAGAARGHRTTRQALDAILREGKTQPGAAEDESLFVAVRGGGVLEIVDTAVARYENDALADDPLHPLRRTGAEALAVVLVLDGARWSAPGGAGALHADRARKTLARLAAGAQEARRRLPVAVVAVTQDAPPADVATPPPPAVEALAAGPEGDGPSLEPAAFVVAGSAASPDPSTREVARSLAQLARKGAREQARRRMRVGALVVAGVVLLAQLWGVLTLRALAGEPRLLALEERSAAARERAFIEEGIARLRAFEAWPLPLPRGAAQEGLARHAGYLEEDLAAHPAVAEPEAACTLAPAQYRNAAEGLALVDALLPRREERARRQARLREKARIAEMPPPSLATIAAWEELWRTSADPVLKDRVVGARLRPLYAAIVREAQREAEALAAYPDLLLPLVERRRERAALADEVFRAALDRQWERATAAISARLHAPGGDDVGTLLTALASAPERPPAPALERMGRWLAEALFATTPTALPADLEASLDRLLGEEGTKGLVAAIPSLYALVIASPPDAGPGRLQALLQLVCHIPRGRLPAAARERTAALEAHLQSLAADGAYSLHVKHVQVSKDFDGFLNPFDMTVVVAPQRGPERTIGPLVRTLELRPAKPLYGPGELRWRAWETIEVRVTDNAGPVGIYRRGPGACFGLRELSGEWIDPASRGRMTIEVTPAPPGPFAFEGW